MADKEINTYAQSLHSIKLISFKPILVERFSLTVGNTGAIIQIVKTAITQAPRKGEDLSQKNRRFFKKIQGENPLNFLPESFAQPM